jgi:hypothetical protein
MYGPMEPRLYRSFWLRRRCDYTHTPVPITLGKGSDVSLYKVAYSLE